MESAAKLDIDKAAGLMEDALKRVSSKVDYADALYDSSILTVISKDTTEERLSRPVAIRGIVFRVFKKGEWREAAFPEIGKKSISQELEQLAAFTPAEGLPMSTISHTSPWKTDVKVTGKKNPADTDSRAKLEMIRHWFGIAKAVDPRIINVQIRYREGFEQKLFLNSEGSRLHQILSRINCNVAAIVKENDRLDYDYIGSGGTGGLEFLDEINDEKVVKLAKSVIELLRAKAVPSGKFDVVLDPGMTGTFAHESFGHGCEADQVLRGRSYLIHHVGEKVGPDNFNLYDDGTLEGGNGFIVFDDEGVPAHNTAIVENGVLRNFMQDRVSASKMNTKPTGNARRESYKRMNYVRMTNTYIGPGDYDFDEMIGEVKDGILFVHWNSGMEDPIGGNMQLKSKRSWRIQNGKLTDIHSTTILSGKVLEFMSNIKGMTRPSDFKVDPGYCGKGHEDFVTVGSGGSYLRSFGVVGQG